MRGIYEPATFDLAGVQAAVDAADAAGGGIVWLGPGDYSFSGTLKVGQANAQHHVNIEGINPVTTRILCDTSDEKAAVYFNLNKYVTFKNVGFVNVGTKGGYGLQLGGDAGSGTQTNGCKLDHLGFQNFRYGLSTSGGIGTSSELLISQCFWQGCDYGFYSANFNGLNYLMLMCEFYDNAIAGAYIAVGNLTVIGGASNNNGNDFSVIGGNDGNFAIRSFRSQAPTGLWIYAPSDSLLSIEDCIVHPRQDGVEVIQAAGELYVRNSNLNGYISWGGFPQSEIDLTHVQVTTPGTDWNLGNQYSQASPPFGPGFRIAPGGINPTDTRDARFRVRDVWEWTTRQLYPDVDGILVPRPSDGSVAPFVTNLKANR